MAATFLAVIFVADIAARAIPARWVTFRGWEAAELMATREGGFAPNVSYDNPASYGDLANMANLPGMREYRRERLTTDSRGFRNSIPLSSPPEMVLLGDSFAVGSGVDDPDTLNAHIHAMAKVPIYNASHFSTRIQRITWLLDQIGVRKGTIVLVVSGTNGVPEWPEVTNEVDRFRQGLERILPTEQAEQAFNYTRGLRHLIYYAPLRVMSKRVVRALWNDKLLPNPDAKHAVIYELKNGKQMLFLPSAARSYEHPDPPNPGYALALNKALVAKGHSLIVLMVPDKYAVYAPLMREARPAPRGRSYFDRLDASFKEAGIRSINLTTIYQAKAAEALAQNQYLYWSDDTHWNGRGIRIAAEAVIAEWRAMGGSR